jgi:hypothetical protein
MRKNKIAMNEAEGRCALYALNELRNRLIAEGNHTDTVDEVILKIVKAPGRKVKIA